MSISNDHTKVSIIIPVYADWPSLNDCLDSLFKFVDFTTHKLIMVNDVGPEADFIETQINKKVKHQKNVEYYRNEKNLGFVNTCNRAVKELDKTKNDILLLNSDTKVTKNFLEEMLEILYLPKGNIGVVSPRTNNATIATIPIDTMAQKGIDPAKSYNLFLKTKDRLPRYVEVPTAHGFCMLTKRKLIDEYGLFDTIFGIGYGEEVDYCLRLKSMGYDSVLSNRAYVFHLEAKSFTLENKIKLQKISKQIIDERYPNYSKDVQEYIKKAFKNELASYGIWYRGKSKLVKIKRRILN